MSGHARVTLVRACSTVMPGGGPAWYPYHVEGYMTEAAGTVRCTSCGERHSRTGERFSWNVPHLDWEGYDFSEAQDPDGVLAKARGEVAP